MEYYSSKELKEALQAISSMLGKCEKALEKLREGSPQHSLLKQRIKALQISMSLITEALNS